MGFGIRIAPGVRISASRRGLRAGIGPRAARIHVGAGRTGFSTGAGPVTYWTTGGRRRSSGRRRSTATRSRGPSKATLAALARQQREAERAEQIAELEQTERALVTVHLEDFPVLGLPDNPPPVALTVDEVGRELVAEAVEGLGWWKVSQRRRAKAKAKVAAPAETEARNRRAVEEHAAELAEDTAYYEAVLANDPEAVLAELEDAFDDNESPAAPIDCRDGVASVVILFAGISTVPEQKPARTPSGRPTLARRTKTERNALYLEAMASTILATVREGYASAPNLQEIRIVVVRRSESPTASDDLETIYVGSFPESAKRWDWEQLRPVVMVALDANLLVIKGQAKEVSPIDLTDEPEVAETVAALARMLAEQDEDEDGDEPEE